MSNNKICIGKRCSSSFPEITSAITVARAKREPSNKKKIPIKIETKKEINIEH